MQKAPGMLTFWLRARSCLRGVVLVGVWQGQELVWTILKEAGLSFVQLLPAWEFLFQWIVTKAAAKILIFWSAAWSGLKSTFALTVKKMFVQEMQYLNVQIWSCSFETLANALVTLFSVPFPFTFLTPCLGNCLWVFAWVCCLGMLMVKEGVSLWNTELWCRWHVECLSNSFF